MKLYEIDSSLNEWNIVDAPGISHARDIYNKFKGNQEVDNVARVLMKQYMYILGVNRGYASRQSLYDFVKHNIEYNDEHHYDADLLQSYKNGFVKYQEKIKNDGLTNQKKEPTFGTPQAEKDKAELDKNILKPQVNKQDLQSLHDLLDQAIKAGGHTKEEMLNYINQLKNNKMLRVKNPELFKAINDINTNESMKIINFASFLVEYDMMAGNSLRGAIQFLKEDDTLEDDTAGEEVSNSEVGENSYNTDYQKYLTLKLPRFAVIYYLKIVARAMINSGIYSYSKKSNANRPHFNGERKTSNREKPVEKIVSKPTSRNIVQTEKLIQYLDSVIMKIPRTQDKWRCKAALKGFAAKAESHQQLSMADIENYRDAKGNELPNILIRAIDRYFERNTL